MSRGSAVSFKPSAGGNDGKVAAQGNVCGGRCYRSSGLGSQHGSRRPGTRLFRGSKGRGVSPADKSDVPGCLPERRLSGRWNLPRSGERLLQLFPLGGFGRTGIRPTLGRSPAVKFRSSVVRFLLNASLLFTAACDYGDVALIPPEEGAGAPSLTVHAAIAQEDHELADALGWQGGIPDADVALHRLEDPYHPEFWISSTTDSMGNAVFYDLLPGRYEVLVARQLIRDGVTTTEVNAFGGGDIVTLAGQRIQVAVGSDRSGALVFSEIAPAEPLPWDFGTYPDAKYVELYNNGDTTVYLDGLIWGMGWHLLRDYPAWPCSQTAEIRVDPLGIWAAYMLKFPGTGTEHAVAPGETVLIARTAIDHSEVNQQLIDLSGADFEIGVGWASADNPDVPNMVDIGLRPFVVNWPIGDEPQFIATPTDPSALDRYTDPYTGQVWIRIPGENIIDATTGVIDYTKSGYVASPRCGQALHPAFERLPGPANSHEDFYAGLSAQRLVLRIDDGRVILRDTNTSMADFKKTERTPGWIP